MLYESFMKVNSAVPGSHFLVLSLLPCLRVYLSV